MKFPTVQAADRVRRSQPANRRPPDLPAESATHRPLSPIEHITGFSPEMLSVGVIEEVELHFREFIPGHLAGHLARRAEHLFEVNDMYRRRVSGINGRAWLLCFFRHWLVGFLAESKPALTRRLPDSFKNGQPLARCGPISGKE
jgi:hypothetical protein